MTQKESKSLRPTPRVVGGQEAVVPRAVIADVQSNPCVNSCWKFTDACQFRNCLLKPSSESGALRVDSLGLPKL